MCDHSKSTYPIKVAADLKPEPQDPGHCHIYYVHQDGKILCEPDVQFGVTSLKDMDKNKVCGEDRLTLVYVKSFETKGALTDHVRHLPSNDFKRIMDLDIPEAGSGEPINWPDPTSSSMPVYFWDKIRNICPYCECKGGILWKNLHRADPHFDACFRYYEGEPAQSIKAPDLEDSTSYRRCFLKRESPGPHLDTLIY